MYPRPLCVVEFGQDRRRVVATLGDREASTCSVDFAKTWLAPEGGVILGFASFEDAAKAVEEGRADYFLVPSAYPELRNFIFARRLKLCDQFEADLPTIVLVGTTSSPEPSSAPPRLYFHPALQDVVAQLRARWGDFEMIRVESNPVACLKLLDDPEALALTNEIAAHAYGLGILEPMREGWPMPCIVFRARKPAEPEDRDLRPFFGGAPPPRVVAGVTSPPAARWWEQPS